MVPALQSESIAQDAAVSALFAEDLKKYRLGGWLELLPVDELRVCPFWLVCSSAKPGVDVHEVYGERSLYAKVNTMATKGLIDNRPTVIADVKNQTPCYLFYQPVPAGASSDASWAEATAREVSSLRPAQVGFHFGPQFDTAIDIYRKLVIFLIKNHNITHFSLAIDPLRPSAILDLGHKLRGVLREHNCFLGVVH